MQEALDTGKSDVQSTDRVHAMLRAALKIAQAEQRHNPNALVFIGVFGLNTGTGCPPILDVCGAAAAFFHNHESSGRALLIARANTENVSYITDYIQQKLTDDEARIVDAHLREHPGKVRDFVHAIPSERTVEFFKSKNRVFATEELVTSTSQHAGTVGGPLANLTIGLITPAAIVIPLAISAGKMAVKRALDAVEDYAVENSDALLLARRICNEWLGDFESFRPQPVGDVIDLLTRLQERSEVNDNTAEEGSGQSNLLDTLRRYMYGHTPMQDALSKSLDVFKKHVQAENRVLVIVSDGLSTDGDPLSVAQDLHQANVDIATVYLTSDKQPTCRRLYYSAVEDWSDGQHVLFEMATRVTGVTHPIPVLTSMGWKVPSAGEIALHAAVSSSTVFDEFCSSLLSARFGSANALFDILGRVSQDSYIHSKHLHKCRNPSNQKRPNCYAHATAAVIHMALFRIVGREGGCPTIKQVRKWIDNAFAVEENGHDTEKVLKAATKWYRPLKFRTVNEDGARQAVLRRRPVLSRFRLSDAGWTEFSNHFSGLREPKNEPGGPIPALTSAQMAPYRSQVKDGGHAVVMTSCNPTSLTFLNSWGHSWGNKGSFSIEDCTVLELDGPDGKYPMQFYDVYWLERDLKETEKQAYKAEVDKKLRRRAAKYPSILELEARCPHCQINAPLTNFEGSIRHTLCPLCKRQFTIEPEHLIAALESG